MNQKWPSKLLQRQAEADRLQREAEAEEAKYQRFTNGVAVFAFFMILFIIAGYL